MADGELDREQAFHGELILYFENEPEKGIGTDCWGEPVDIAAAILAATENDDVIGVVVALTRGIPEDAKLQARKDDPRDE